MTALPKWGWMSGGALYEVQLNLEPRTETRTYNPAIAAIPF